MKILVVGGTGFLGGAITKAAIEAGHDTTVLTRGTKPAPAGAKAIVANRTLPLPDLNAHSFDAVIDTCAYAPTMVDHLRAAIGTAHYVMVSSISVYPDISIPQITEDHPAPPATTAILASARNATTSKAQGEAYGPLKRSCEIAAGDHATIIRLGLIVGPHDNTDRFTWWVRRGDQGGTIPLPAPKDRTFQVIDVRDAAQFALRCAENQLSGCYHVTGPVWTFSALLHEIIAQTGAAVSFVWKPLDHFTALGLVPWQDLPLILPDDEPLQEMMNVSIAKAVADGLVCRPLAETIRDTLEWDRGRRGKPLAAGMAPAAEAEALKA